MREWLNNEFINDAFTDAEREKIELTMVTADSNPDSDADPGYDTKDKVFLLSIEEANNYFSSSDDRMCVPSDYAIEQGAYTFDDKCVDGKATCRWWLRPPGCNNCCASYVNYDGEVDCNGNFGLDGCNVDDAGECVRPAIWVSIR